MGEHVGHISDEAVFEVLRWGLLGLVAILAPFLKKNGVKRIAVRGGWSAFLVFLFFSQVIAAITYHQKSGFDNGVWFAVTIFGTVIYGFHFFMFNSNWIFALEDKIRDWWTSIRELARPDYTPQATPHRDLPPAAQMIAQLEEVDYRSEGLFRLTRQLNQVGAEAVEPLIVALSHPRANVRRNAAYTLGEIKDNRAIKPLIEAFNDPDMVLVSAMALAEFGRPAIEPLAEAARDTNTRVRDGAITALGWCKDVRSIEELDKLFNEWLDERQSEGQKLIGTSEKLLEEYWLPPTGNMTPEERAKLSTKRREALSELRKQSNDYHTHDQWWLGRKVVRALSNIATNAIKCSLK